MSCIDLILEAAVELFMSFGSFFLHLTQPMKSTLALSLCQSVSLSLFYVLLFAFILVSLFHVLRTNTLVHSTRRGASQEASKRPCSDR